MPGVQREEVESWKGNPWGKLPTWARWTVGVLGVVVLLAIGAAIGSSEEDDLEADLSRAESQLAKANQERDEAQASADAVFDRKKQILAQARLNAAKIIGNARSERSRLSGMLKSLEGDIDATKGELSEAESSLAGAEREEALSSFGDGIWQANVDFLPGTYRSEGGDGCYYATLGSADTSDILTNEITLDASQQIVTIESPYFQSKSCGTWERIE